MSDEQQKEKRPLSMTRRYRRGLVIVGLLCMMVTLAIATVLFQRSYTVRVDKYLSQICDSVAAGYKAQPTHDAVTLANLLPESDTSLRFSLIDGGGTVLSDSEAAAGVVSDKDGKVYAVVQPLDDVDLAGFGRDHDDWRCGAGRVGAQLGQNLVAVLVG